MFQNIVNATEPMADEKEAISFVSNNPTRKEIVMYVADFEAGGCGEESVRFTFKSVYEISVAAGPR